MELDVRVDGSIDDISVTEQTTKEYPWFYALYATSSSNAPNNINERNLDVIFTNLISEKEEVFRSFIAKRLVSCTLRPREGNLCTLDFSPDVASESPFICYYVQILKVRVVALTETDCFEINETSSSSNQEFIVCFLANSDVNLEFFRSELDEFCNNLASQLESDPKVTKSNEQIRTYLEKWADISVNYLCRCLKLLRSDIAVLFYLTSVTARLEIEGGEDDVRSDVLRFLSSCGIAEMIRDSSSAHCTDSADKDPQPVALFASLKLNTDGSYEFSGAGCDQYCKDWANLMLDGEQENPMFLKRVVENFKLLTVQSLNTFKRLLIEAETDYYALYRAYVFLKNSKQGLMLLQHAKLNEDSNVNRNMSDIIGVLESFMQVES